MRHKGRVGRVWSLSEKRNCLAMRRSKGTRHNDAGAEVLLERADDDRGQFGIESLVSVKDR